MIHSLFFLSYADTYCTMPCDEREFLIFDIFLFIELALIRYKNDTILTQRILKTSVNSCYITTYAFLVGMTGFNNIPQPLKPLLNINQLHF